MNPAILPSILLLTVLMAIGLVFFIRASFKDRTETVKLTSPQAGDSLLPQLQQYFAARSYLVKAVNPEKNQVIYEGFVQPSIFLAVFIVVLAAVGILSLALVFSMLFPERSLVFSAPVVLSPAAGWLYWQKAGRKEQVSLFMEPTQNEQPSNRITVTGHRDELAALQKTLELQPTGDHQ